MKVSELKQIVENIVIDEVRKTIMKESEGKKEVYHIKCEGIPLATFESEEEANEALPDYKEKHKDGELIIEKGVYENHDDMINKLDEMNDQLEETEDMENTQPMEGNEFSGALRAAKDAGEKTFSVDGKEYNVEECWSKQMEEEECDECGGSYMEEEKEGGDDFEDMLRGRRRRHYFGQKEYVDGDNSEEDVDDTEWIHDHPKDKTDHDPEEMGEEKKCCEKCGKEVCECGGMYESKKKSLRLTETELTKMIAKMVSESVPGLDAAKKAHTESGKENKANLAAVEKKIAGMLKFDGNDNPEFPKAIGKGEKVARKNTPAQEDEIKKNFAGLENLDYDIEPDEKFKKRLKMAIEGDTTMGNAPTTEPAKIKPSNGADKGEDSKDKDGNSIPTPETAKGIQKQVKDRQKDKDNRELYNKQAVPVKSKSINEEVDKMKKMFKYNEKTQ